MSRFFTLYDFRGHGDKSCGALLKRWQRELSTAVLVYRTLATRLYPDLGDNF